MSTAAYNSGQTHAAVKPAQRSLAPAPRASISRAVWHTGRRYGISSATTGHSDLPATIGAAECLKCHKLDATTTGVNQE